MFLPTDNLVLKNQNNPKLYQRWPQTDVEIFNYIVHANQGTQSGRQVWETSVGDKCGRQVEE